METWLEVLQAEVAASSLAQVAEKLGLSRTTISQVCNEKYPGDMARGRSGCPHSQLTEAQQLRRPMRLSVEQGKGAQKTARYDAEATLSRLRRQAKSDGDNASSSLRILSELLAEELKIMAIKYNRLLDKQEGK